MNRRPLTDSQEQLLMIVQRLRCATARQIAQEHGTTQENCSQSLRLLRDRGLIVVSGPGGKHCMWATPENIDLSTHLRQKLIAEAEQKGRAAKRIKDRQYKRNSAERRFERWSSEVTQRIIPATEAKPLKVMAVRSIFELAEAK
jgi:predicted ArsR family transcriptional regulator